MTTVYCDQHGLVDEAFVCRHIADSLRTGIAVGFHWPANSKARYPDAWCTDCDLARLASGGEWTSEIEGRLHVKIVCGTCYENAKAIWQRARDQYLS